MATEKDRIFVAIGVSKPDGGLEALPGAITAATRMAAWANAQGYLTVLAHDGANDAVTVELLRDQMTSAINAVTSRTPLRRIIVFFAGHGAAQGVDDQLWMLTGWHRRPTEAVKVVAMQRMLELYGTQQVCIIGDACQEYSARFVDVTGSPILDRPDEEARSGLELDRFFAVDVGKQAFMVKADDDQQAFCIFTEVLLDALEGDAEDALESSGAERRVTSQSLARHLAKSVPVEAGKHFVTMTPRPFPGFYSDPTYAVFPGPSGGIAGGGAPPPPSPSPSAHDAALILPDFDLLDTGGVPARARSVPRVRSVRPSADPQVAATRSRKLSQARESRQVRFASEVRQATVRDHFETGAGICVSGADVTAIQSSNGEPSPVHENPNWFRVRLTDNSSMGWSDALLTLDGERLCSVCIVQGFVAALHSLSDGRSTSLFHRPIGANVREDDAAIDMLARLQAGLLTPDMIVDVAARLRVGKHRVITMGCIAAQFYDAIRDVDSLRQMASFYAEHGQPVPLDIVLFGGGTISDEGGQLYANIPAVATRQPRTPMERERLFTFQASAGYARHPIAGRVPWMNQAWSAVATASCDRTAASWREDALAAMPHLGSGVFTTFAPAAHEAVARLARIELRGQAQAATM